MRDDVVAGSNRLTTVAAASLKELDRGIEIIPVNRARAPDSHDSLPIALSNDRRSSRRATDHSLFSIMRVPELHTWTYSTDEIDDLALAYR